MSHHQVVELEEVPRLITGINYFQIYTTETKLTEGIGYAQL